MRLRSHSLLKGEGVSLATFDNKNNSEIDNKKSSFGLNKMTTGNSLMVY